MTKGLLTLVVTLGILLGATAASAMRAGEPFIGLDPIGDAGAAPDIAMVVIGAPEDVPAGTVVVGLAIENFPPTGDGSVTLWLDTDENASTGSPTGNEYAFVFDNVGGYSWGFQRWNGTTFEPVSPPATMQVIIDDGVAAAVFNKADIGRPDAVRVYVVGVSMTSPISGIDRAPDSGSWTVDLKPTPRPVIGKPTAIPAAPIAGKRFTVSFRVTTSDSGKPLTKGTMTCDPSIAGKVLKHAESFTRGTARLVMTAPESAKGKQLKVRVVITSAGQSATRVATYRVRGGSA